MMSKEYINFFKEEGWVEQVYAWHMWCLGFILSITLIKEEKQMWLGPFISFEGSLLMLVSYAT